MSCVQLSIPVALLVENVLTSGEPSELIIDRLQRKEFSSLLSKIKEPTMDLKADQDYIQEDLTLKDIHLTLQETELLQLLVGRQWIVQEEQGKDQRDKDRDTSLSIPVHIRLKY